MRLMNLSAAMFWRRRIALPGHKVQINWFSQVIGCLRRVLAITYLHASGTHFVLKLHFVPRSPFFHLQQNDREKIGEGERGRWGVWKPTIAAAVGTRCLELLRSGERISERRLMIWFSLQPSYHPPSWFVLFHIPWSSPLTSYFSLKLSKFSPDSLACLSSYYHYY